MGLGVLLGGVRVPLTGRDVYRVYSVLVVVTVLLVALAVSAFCVVGETAASRYARAARELRRSTRGKVRVSIPASLDRGEAERLLSSVEASAAGSGLDYAVQRIGYAEVLGSDREVAVTGVRGSLSLGEGWSDLEAGEALVAGDLGLGTSLTSFWDHYVQVGGVELEVVGVVSDVVPLYSSRLVEGVLSFDLQSWDSYLVVCMEDWDRLFSGEGAVQVVAEVGDAGGSGSVWPGPEDPLRSEAPGVLAIGGWAVPDPASSNLFRAMAYSISSIALAGGLVAVFSCTNSISLLRSRELGLMRAVGGDMGQVRKLFLGEIGALAMLGAVPGAVIGVAVSLPLLEVLDMPIHLDIFVTQSLLSVAVCMVGALTASSISLSRVGGRWPAEVLRWSGGFGLR